MNLLMRQDVLVGILITSVLSGCSGVSPVQVGQTAGTIAGAAIAPGVGAPIGTLVGTLAGLVLEHQIDKGREQKERVDLSKQLNAPTPASVSPSDERPFGQPTRVWVDERVENGRLIAGHFELRTIP